MLSLTFSLLVDDCLGYVIGQGGAGCGGAVVRVLLHELFQTQLSLILSPKLVQTSGQSEIIIRWSVFLTSQPNLCLPIRNKGKKLSPCVFISCFL